MSRALGGSGFGALVANQGLHERSSTQKHRLGTPLRRGDCVYKYAKHAAAMTLTHRLAWSTSHQDIMYAAIPTANPIGDNEIHVTVGAADGVNNDGEFLVHCMQGGHLVIFYAPAVLSNGVVAVFQIRDNTAAVSGGDMTITIDGELPRATVVGTSIIEAMASPYIVSTGDPAGVRWMVGMPMHLATVAEPYVWLQTWGPTWCAPQSRVGDAANNGTVVARHDGSLDVSDQAGYANAQIVGSVMNYSQAGGQGAPFVYLQISR